MKPVKVHEIAFTQDTIVSVTLSRPDELVMLTRSGWVIRYPIRQQKAQYLFSVNSDIQYGDGGFDLDTRSTIYTLNDIVVVVNDYKTHGFIHYPGKYHKLHLWRKDYYADLSCYPLALFKDKEGTPHIIYGEAWNHIQIMNLDTRQVLTAAKSLIEENGEESHIELYKRHNEENKLPWPRPYDYFFGKLLLSPDQKKFLSAGWGWGSYDAYNIFDIHHFITSNRIASISIGAWEHANRAVCWVDHETIAIAYHPFQEGEDGATASSTCEIHLYRYDGDRTILQKKIQTAHKGFVKSNMYYDNNLKSFIIFSREIGLLIISQDGQINFEDQSFKIEGYHSQTRSLVILDNKAISFFKVME